MNLKIVNPPSQRKFNLALDQLGRSHNSKLHAMIKRTPSALSSELAKLCGISQREASSILKKYDNNLERAADAIFSGEVSLKKSGGSSGAGANKLEALFNKYKVMGGDSGQNDDEIGIDGTIAYINDLGLDPEDPIVLVLAQKLDSPGEGRFNRRGFVDGWMTFDVDSIDGMKEQVGLLREEFNTPNSMLFETVYQFAFKYNLQDGQRMLPVAYWSLLLEGRFSKLQEWVTFVTEHYKKSISRDTWNMILEFVKYMKDDPKLEAYDAEGAWPSVIDEFVEYLKQH